MDTLTKNKITWLQGIVLVGVLVLFAVGAWHVRNVNAKLAEVTKVNAAISTALEIVQQDLVLLRKQQCTCPKGIQPAM